MLIMLVSYPAHFVFCHCENFLLDVSCSGGLYPPVR